MSRTAEWSALRAKLKPRFEAAGITSCEVRRKRCLGSWPLAFAHSLKRRNIPRGSPLLAEVVVACQQCHSEIELLKEADMAAVVRGIIEERIVAVEAP